MQFETAWLVPAPLVATNLTDCTDPDDAALTELVFVEPITTMTLTAVGDEPVAGNAGVLELPPPPPPQAASNTVETALKSSVMTPFEIRLIAFTLAPPEAATGKG